MMMLDGCALRVLSIACKQFSNCIKGVVVREGGLVFQLRVEFFLLFLTALRKHCWFQLYQLVDLTCQDYPDRCNRYWLVYLFLSHRFNFRLIVEVSVNEFILTCISIFPAVGWAEREVWDLFGLRFVGHPDLRRLLTDYGFDGYPLRKDFPVVGFLEVRYDEQVKRLVFEPTELVQHYRQFSFVAPWLELIRVNNN